MLSRIYGRCNKLVILDSLGCLYPNIPGCTTIEKIALTALMLSSLFAVSVLASQYDRPGFASEIQEGCL